jgi:haloalkane dehalogenase
MSDHHSHSARTPSTPTTRAAATPALTEADVSARLRGAPDSMLSVGHAQLAYWRFGQGPDVVCVHGWPLHAATWRRIVPLLAGEFTLHLIDLPGTGQSVWDAGSRIGIAEHAASVREAVAQLGLERFAYIGHDSGAAITRLAAADDARVFANVIADSEIPGHTPWQVSAFIRLSKAPAIYRAVVRALRFGWLRRSPLGFGGCFTDPRYVDGEFGSWFMAPLTQDARVLEGQTRLLTHFDHAAIDSLREAHAQLHAPSLLVWGARDGFFPVAKARAMLPQFTAGAELIELPRARLFPHEDHAEAFADAIRPFLRRHASTPR